MCQELTRKNAVMLRKIIIDQGLTNAESYCIIGL